MDFRAVAEEAVTGRGALQDPWELAALLQLAGHPGLVVEIGCYSGGTLYAWSCIADEVIGVTLETAPGFRAYGAVVIRGDSAAEPVRAEVRSVLAGRRPGLVFVDGGHQAWEAEADWQFAESLNPAAVAFHDIGGHGEVRDVWDKAKDGRRYAEFINPRPTVSNPAISPAYRVLGAGILWMEELWRSWTRAT